MKCCRTMKKSWGQDDASIRSKNSRVSAPAARARAPPLLRSKTFNFMALKKIGSERSGVGPEFEKGDGRLRPTGCGP